MLFYILSGSNGASYIINISSLDAIQESLKFYKARTIKQKIQKTLFSLYLSLLRLFKTKLKSLQEVEHYLVELCSHNIDFQLDSKCSILVSPTRDKVIVHHHGEFFEKFAFGKSYANVKKESDIYKLLDRDLVYFEVSKMYDKVNTLEYCSFKLSTRRNNKSKKNDFTLALVEFFSVTLEAEHSLQKSIETILAKLSSYSDISLVLQTYKDKYSHATIPLGLVHRDFKPWNIKDDNEGLLIFDFEETVTDGLPLEDMLNYIIDPIIRYEDVQSVAKKVLDDAVVKEFQRYLKVLNIELDIFVLLNLYLAQRVVFWEEVGDKKSSQDYVELFKYINKEELSGAK